MMNINPSRRDYADLYKEIKNLSSPELLKKVIFKLNKENEHLLEDCDRANYALSETHSLMNKLYSTLQNKMSEMHLMKRCLSISMDSRDIFLKDYVKFLDRSCSEGFQKIFSTLTCDPRLRFLSQTIDSASLNLLMSRFITSYYAENLKKYDSEFPEKPSLEECLGYMDHSITLVMKMMKILKRLFRILHGYEVKPANNAKSSRRKGERSSLENCIKKKRKIQEKVKDSGSSKLIDKETQTMDNIKLQEVVPVGNQMDVDISKSENEFESQIPVFKRKIKPARVRTAVVRLTDVLNDPAADSDPVVALYKQATLLKDNEDKVSEDVETSSEEEDTVSNNDKSDQTDSDVPEHKSCNSSSEQMRDELSNSGLDADSQDEDDETKSQGNSKSDYPEFRRGPRTPPPPSPPEIVIRNSPHTPPGAYLRNFPYRRGPRTPPPPSPPTPPSSPLCRLITSDNEDVDSNSEDQNQQI